MRRAAVAQPSIELARFLQLLATHTWHCHKAATELRQGRHITPELFKLGHREDIFLTFAPALFDVLERDVGRHARSDTADRSFDPISVGERIAGQVEYGEQTVHIDPVCRAVVVAKTAFQIFAGKRQTLNQSNTAIHSGEAASAIFDVPGYHFCSKSGAAMNVM